MVSKAQDAFDQIFATSILYLKDHDHFEEFQKQIQEETGVLEADIQQQMKVAEHLDEKILLMETCQYCHNNVHG